MSGALKRDEWETVRLGDVCYFIKSGRNKVRNLDGIYPVYGSTGIIGQSSNYVYEGSNILIARVGAHCGLVNIADGKYDVSDNTLIVSLKPNYDLKYSYYQLICLNLNKLSVGAGQPLITATKIKNIDIPLPPLDVQRRIADTLDKVTELITLRKTQLKKLDELVKARFVEMFGDVALNPNGYPVKDFDEISVLITDGEHATPRRTEEGIYLLSARNVLNHTLQLDDVDYIDEEEYNRIARRVIPQAGDVLISCSGSIGRCCVVPDGLKFQMVRSAALIRFDDTINPIFAEWLITSDDLQRQIAQSATQSSQANLFQGKIRKLHGYVPPMELQDQFVAFLKQTDKSKVIIQQSLDTLETLQKSLMQEYFG